MQRNITPIKKIIRLHLFEKYNLKGQSHETVICRDFLRINHLSLKKPVHIFSDIVPLRQNNVVKERKTRSQKGKRRCRPTEKKHIGHVVRRNKRRHVWLSYGDVTPKEY